MLAKARAAAPDCRFEQGDFATWAPAAGEALPDLIYSNAALHWVGGHETLFPRLVSLLAPGGVLAVQMPAMHDAPLRRLQNEVAAYGPWAETLRDAGFARAILPAEAYYDLLRPHVAALDLWETTYLHVLSGEDAVVEWAAGSSLRPFLDKLPEGLRARVSCGLCGGAAAALSAPVGWGDAAAVPEVVPGGAKVGRGAFVPLSRRPGCQRGLPVLRHFRPRSQRSAGVASLAKVGIARPDGVSFPCC